MPVAIFEAEKYKYALGSSPIDVWGDYFYHGDTPDMDGNILAVTAWVEKDRFKIDLIFIDTETADIFVLTPVNYTGALAQKYGTIVQTHGIKQAVEVAGDEWKNEHTPDAYAAPLRIWQADKPES